MWVRKTTTDAPFTSRSADYIHCAS
jgi:hypothetical protein